MSRGSRAVGKPPGSKVMTTREAAGRHAFDGAVAGIGGQSIGRCNLALGHSRSLGYPICESSSEALDSMARSRFIVA